MKRPSPHKRHFPHHHYLAAALIMAAGGFALTIGIVSGDRETMAKILDAFLQAFCAGVVGLATAAAFKSRRKED